MGTAAAAAWRCGTQAACVPPHPSRTRHKNPWHAASQRASSMKKVKAGGRRRRYSRVTLPQGVSRGFLRTGGQPRTTGWSPWGSGPLEEEDLGCDGRSDPSSGRLRDITSPRYLREGGRGRDVRRCGRRCSSLLITHLTSLLHPLLTLASHTAQNTM